MERIDLEIDDFINYCDYKGLSKKTYGSYEQSLRLLVIYLKEKFAITKTEQVKEKHLKDYIDNLKERGKYTVVYNEKTKKTNNPQNRGDFGKKVSPVTINNYIRNMRVMKCPVCFKEYDDLKLKECSHCDSYLEKTNKYIFPKKLKKQIMYVIFIIIISVLVISGACYGISRYIKEKEKQEKYDNNKIRILCIMMLNGFWFIINIMVY